MKFTLKKRPQSALGLSVSDGQLRAALVGRTKEGWGVLASAAAALTLDPLHPESDLIGREIKNHLDAAEIRERTCVVALPAKWVMSQQTKLPDLPAEDVDSFLNLEAEKGFPCDVNQLQIARSFQQVPGATYVTQLAVRKEQLERLAAVARAAGLKPVSFTLGLAALPGVVAPAGDGRITLVVEAHGAALVISSGGGITAFRTFEAAIDSEGGEKVVNSNALARELRITFEQVPAELRAGLRHLRLTGDAVLIGQLADRMREWAGAAGLAIEDAGAADDQLGALIAQSVARQWLAPGPAALEFLPARPSRWQGLLARYNAKRLATVGIAVGALAVLALAAFGYQEYRLWELGSEWSAMQVQVGALKQVQGKIRDYRPWYDRSFTDLRILARVTQCFPQNGSVTAKSFDVHKVGAVTTVDISGTARDGQALLRTQDQLRQAKEIQGLKFDNISGKMPAQFTLTFHWIGNPGS